MRPIPKPLLQKILNDPWYEICCYSRCGKQAEIEHAFIYSGRQINEYWALIPCCPYHNRGAGLDKSYNQWVALRRATPEDLAKYPKTNWRQLLAHLNAKYDPPHKASLHDIWPSVDL